MPRRFSGSFIFRLGRSLLPSPISGLLCSLIGIAAVGAYLVLLSVSLGTSFPALFEGEWGVAYTNHVVRPLLSIFSNFTLNKVLFLTLWGVAGLATYFLLEYAIRVFKGAKSAKRDIQLTATGIIRHPAMSSFFLAALWRAGVLVVFLPLLALAIKLPLTQLSALAPQAVLGSLSAGNTIMQLLLMAVQFAVFSHLSVVFLRLFAMRMRLFGDDPM